MTMTNFISEVALRMQHDMNPPPPPPDFNFGAGDVKKLLFYATSSYDLCSTNEILRD